MTPRLCCAIMPVMSRGDRWSESLFSPDRMVVPIGSSWGKTKIDQKVIAGYRFFAKERSANIQYARRKTRLDIAGAFYLLLVIVSALLQGRPASHSLASILVNLSSAFTLQPFVPAHLAHTRFGHVIPLLVFLSVGYCVLLHESRSLAERIYIYRPLEGFIRRERTLTGTQLALTLASRIINHLLAAGLILTAAAYLWRLRFIDWMRSPLEIPTLLLSGVLLTVIGISKTIEAMESDETEPWLLILEVLGGAILTGAAFAAVMALGLQHGSQGGATGFCFGAGMALTAWLLRHFIVRPSQKRLPPAVEPWIRRFIFLPLIAMGRAIDVILAGLLQFVIRPIQLSLIALFTPFLTLFVRVLRKLPYRIVRAPLEWADSYLYEPPPLSKVEMLDTFEEKGRTEDGRAYGLLHRAQTPPPPHGFVAHVRSSLLSGLFAEDSWLTRWLKREPIRLISGLRGSWEREDPLDFKRRVRLTVGIWPPTQDLDRLYRRLLSLMLATFLIAYVVELAVGHVVAYMGKPLLDHGPLYATLFGLGVGALFAMVGIFGHSSIGVLTLGLVSGLALDPTLGLAGGMAYRIGHDGLLFAITLVLTLIIDTQQKRSIFVVGILAAAAGVYLQYLPQLVKV
jgi:hypothetical protein